ncbi:MAG: hypothetical protein HKO76_07705 [Acidimicrobiia bacterium]|nr:hypothetical protein [Acidimicrobiia bacterium]
MAEANAQDLEVFMAAIRRLESGSYSGNYEAGYNKGDAHAKGAYQIMPQYWDDWAREAGIAGADPRDPAAQDFVARYKFKDYFRRLGDWRLVAIAWFAGLSRARKAQTDGIASLTSISDSYGTSVPKYVTLIDKYMTDYADSAGYTYQTAQSTPGLLSGDATAIEQAKASQPQPQPGPVTAGAKTGTNIGSVPSSIGRPGDTLASIDINDPRTTVRSNLTAMLSTMSNAIKAGATNPLLSGEDGDEGERLL